MGINGLSFLIHGNLYEFLQEMRRRGSNEELWIDAFCIDQNNAKERNHQVAQIATIYLKANRVVYWLAKGLVEHHVEADLTPPELESGLRDDAAQAREKLTELFWQCDMTGRLPPTAHALATLAHAEYWHRTWISQEVLTSQSRGFVAFGQCEVS